jgi:hypothetical protein
MRLGGLIGALAVASTLAMGGTASASGVWTVGALSVSDLGSVNPLTSSNALISDPNATLGYTSNAPTAVGVNYGVGWDPFGTADTTHNWMSVGGASGGPNGGEAIFNFTSARSNFTLVWGSASSTNTIDFYSGANGQGTLLGQVTVNDLFAAESASVTGFANIANTTDPGALISITSGANQFESAVLTNGANQGGFEIAVVSPVPLPAALPLFGAALAGLGGIGFRMRRRKTS